MAPQSSVLVVPPIDFGKVRDALWDAIQQATGLGANSVVMGQPEMPIAKRPEVPFAEFMISGVSQAYGRDAMFPTEEDGVYRYAGPRLMTAQFQFFGETHEQAYGLAAAFQAALSQEPTLDLLRAAGIVVWDRQGVTDLSALMLTGYEGRAAFNASFGLHSDMRVKVGTIASVPVSVAITSEPQQDAINFTVDLPEG